jgi:Metallo-peptidase family M12B Reprolysin-like/Secretion system C-terminal sorting domain
MKQFLTTVFFSALIITTTQAQSNYWTYVNENSLSVINQERVIKPTTYTTYHLNSNDYKTFLATAPKEFTTEAKNTPLQISVPMPNHTMAIFNIWESKLMEDGLAQQVSFIKTYTGQGIDDPTATIKIDFTSRGFHAMILSKKGNVFIDPYYKNSFDYYISYYQKEYNPINKVLSICKGVKKKNVITPTQRTMVGNGTQLKTYRLAVACTGEYSQFFGGTVAGTASAIATTINRVNGVYEKELAVRLVLVSNNNALIFTDPTTDPFDGNDDPVVLITESQNNIDAIIGNANYDIGHTFSTGAGGFAGLGVVCTTAQKGLGVTGSSSPVGDPYDIDYVAHEIGHQFGADHSFNGEESNCGGGNRNPSTAYEVGSGSTIMAYAGICGTQNIQNNSDPFFHTTSFDEMVNYITVGDGNTCPVITNNGNSIPVVTTGGSGFTIPKNTPFTLTGAAVDANGDALTYNWEQFDLGTAGLNTSTSTTGPNFRSFAPTSSSTRTFPRINNIVNNVNNFGEVLYNGNTNRVFNFRLTVRDNRATGGGVDYAPLSFTVSGTAGPLAITAPNITTTWSAGSNQTITWNVNSTNVTPINCTNVSILFSTDGGLTYSNTILASTPNDGTETIVVPSLSTITGRIKVSCNFSNYSFFDINDANITINVATPVSLTQLQASCKDESIVVNWQTVTEYNTASFTIEKSSDGNSFVTIGSIAAIGNSNVLQNYFYTDLHPFEGANYYRLKIIDHNGNYTYSKVVLVKYTKLIHFQISPNPTKNNIRIIVPFVKGNALLQLFSMEGKLVFEKKYSSVTSINEWINVKNYSDGMYQVKYTSQNITTTQKLLILKK